MQEEEKILTNAQYRKSLSISFFNATNTAIEIVKKEIEVRSQFGIDEDAVKSRLTFWRNWLLDEHKKFYAEVVQKVGLPYDKTKTIERLQSITKLEDLKPFWLSISADERHDPEIKKVLIEVKNKLENEKA